MRIVYLLDVSASVDIQEVFKMGEKELKFMKVLFIVKILNYLL